MEEVLIIILMLVIAFVQWLFGKIRGGDEEEPQEENREEWTRRMEQQREERQQRRRQQPDGNAQPADSEQEAYRRLMEALGIPAEEQPAQAPKVEEPKPSQQQQPPPMPRREPASAPRRGPQRQEEAAENPYVIQQKSWREQQRQRQAEVEKAEREAERARKASQKKMSTGGMGGIDEDHLERTEVGTAEIGSGAEIGQGEEQFSWDRGSAGRHTTGFSGMGAVSSASAYSIRVSGPVRRVSRGEVLEMLRNKENLKKGIVLREILGPPKALQPSGVEVYYENL